MKRIRTHNVDDYQPSWTPQTGYSFNSLQGAILSQQLWNIAAHQAEKPQQSNALPNESMILSINGLKLREPIRVQLFRDGEDWKCSAPGVSIRCYGGTREEAIAEFKDYIRAAWENIVQQPEHTLHTSALALAKQLKNYVREAEETA